MKWFKHYSDNHRGQSVNRLFDELGYFGPFLYYTIYEICNEKLEKRDDRVLIDADCEFRIHRRVICSAVRAKPSSVDSGMILGQSCKLWSFKKDGEFYEIKIPILLDLLESDQKKKRHKSATKASKKRLEEEEDKEEDIYKKNIKKEILSDEFRANKIGEYWNDYARDYKLSTIKLPLSADRIKLIKLALKEFPEADDWSKIICAIGYNPFNLGSGPDGWKANFDWLFHKTKFNYRKMWELYESTNGENDGSKQTRTQSSEDGDAFPF